MTFDLNLVTRAEQGPKTRQLGKLPGVLYGAGEKTVAIALDSKEFLKVYTQAGESSLIDAQLDAGNIGKIIVQSVQLDPVTDGIIHVDLKRIDMNKKMTAPVELNFVGEAPIIKSEGGTLVANLDTVEVECLPKDLIARIDVDLGSLKTFADAIKVKDLILPPGIVITNPHQNDMVAKATPALTEEEIKAMEEAATKSDVSKIEALGEKKESEEEAAAGEGEKKEGPEAGKPEDSKDDKQKPVQKDSKKK